MPSRSQPRKPCGLATANTRSKEHARLGALVGELGRQSQQLVERNRRSCSFAGGRQQLHPRNSHRLVVLVGLSRRRRELLNSVSNPAQRRVERRTFLQVHPPEADVGSVAELRGRYITALPPVMAVRS